MRDLWASVERVACKNEILAPEGKVMTLLQARESTNRLHVPLTTILDCIPRLVWDGYMRLDQAVVLTRVVVGEIQVCFLS